MVASLSDTLTICARAISPPLRIASATSPALPNPTPTRPRLSPTTTSALKLKRRPPLTTLAERLINTTFSVSSCPSCDPSLDLLRPRRPRNPRFGRSPPPPPAPPLLSVLVGSATIFYLHLKVKTANPLPAQRRQAL